MVKDNNRYLWGSAAFTFFLIVVSWKLTNASLWFDETVEFYYSQISLSDMYKKVVTTFQPPLYNFILHFWIKISENEWWFRFSGVVFGFIGCTGLFKTIRKLSSFNTACISVIVYAVSYNIVYYLQEAAEYALLLGVLGWVMCFFVYSQETPSCKNIIFFVISCVLAMYSQYGAVFIVIPACVVLLGMFIKKHQIQESLLLCGSGAAAGIFAGLPLLLFFIIPQMKNQGTSSGNLQGITFDGNILKDVWKNFCKVIQWIFLGETEITLNIMLKVCLFIILVLIMYQFIVSKDTIYKMSILVFVISFFLYYITVKLGFYATNSYTNDNFGNRYNLFLGPWFLMVVSVTLKKIFCSCYKGRPSSKVSKYGSMLCGVVLILCAVFVHHNYIRLNNNWAKEDARGGVNYWYSVSGYERETLVYYGNEYGFKYYMEHDGRYSEEYLKNITYQPWSRGISEADFEQYLLDTYENSIPETLYLSASHINGDINSMLQVFSNRGFVVETAWQGNNACVYYIHY